MSDVITPEPCHCCLEAVAVAFSNDLQRPVCMDCVTQLRWADAWLKVAGIRGCTQRTLTNRFKEAA